MKYKQFSVLFCVFTRFRAAKISVGKYTVEPFVLKEWMNTVHENTNQYTVLNLDRSSRTMQIDLYDYATLKKRQL
jgi:dipeptidyl-peptidase-4